MNRDFLSNFEHSDQQSKKEREESVLADPVGDVEYQNWGQLKYVCFIWPNGNRKFYFYNRLDAGEINPDYDTIKLSFGAEIVELMGLGLLPLFESFMEHRRKYVYCDDSRYNDLTDNEPVVNEIVIQKSL